MPGLKGEANKLFKIRHRTPKPVFCPKCGSHKMKVKESYGILPHMYRCTECGYEGSLILEIEEE